MLERLASPFKFTAASVAAVAVVIYAALFTSVLVFDDLPRVPKNTRGLDLDRAYEALSVVRHILEFVLSVEQWVPLQGLAPSLACCQRPMLPAGRDGTLYSVAAVFSLTLHSRRSQTRA